MENHELMQLLEGLSLEEKINQMSQVSGGFFLNKETITGPMRERGFTAESIMLAGSVIGVSDAGDMIQIQEEYMAKHPHGIPLLFMLDVINGFGTSFPIPLGQGATFEPELSARCAAAAAAEAAASGVHVTFAPMSDLVRDARWGRVMESTGEDPMLNGLFTAAMVKGFQGTELKDSGTVAACVKHFAGYGAPVAGKEYHTVELSEHTLRQFYLPAYQKGIDVGSALVMTSFNTIEGIPATGNIRLMQEFLRGEMGFEGVLISDWTSIEEMIAHGYCEDRKEAALRAIQAGVDIDMMSGIYSEALMELVQEGQVSETLIDDAVMRILKLKNQLGLFERPYKDANVKKSGEVILCRQHRELAEESALKSLVLLKNEKVLPLDNEQKVAFIGPYTDEKEMEGAWSLFARREEAVTIREAAELLLVDASYYQGCPLADVDVQTEAQKEVGERIWLEAAIGAEVVIMPLGEHRLQTGEAASQGEITIPEVQMDLFRKVYEVNQNIIVVLFCGRPLDIREISRKARAVMVAWMPGTEGGNAIMKALTGFHNPSGKLSMSFPYCVGQVPVCYNEYATGRPRTEEKADAKYVAGYLDIPNEPLYPFGYGMSYTRFDISPISLDKVRIQPEDVLWASVVIENIGDRSGTEVVQLYIRDVTASVVRPVKELKAFRKVSLAPGERQVVEFAVTEEMLRFYSHNKRFESEGGLFYLWIGDSSSTNNHVEFYLDK